VSPKQGKLIASGLIVQRSSETKRLEEWRGSEGSGGGCRYHLRKSPSSFLRNLVRKKRSLDERKRKGRSITGEDVLAGAGASQK